MALTLNIETLADQLYATFKTSVLTTVANGVPELISVATEYVKGEEKLLKDLGVQFLNKQIDLPFLEERLKEVKTDFIDSLISLEQIIASDIQTLVNSLIDMFANLLQAALSVIK